MIHTTIIKSPSIWVTNQWVMPDPILGLLPETPRDLKITMTFTYELTEAEGKKKEKRKKSATQARILWQEGDS